MRTECAWVMILERRTENVPDKRGFPGGGGLHRPVINIRQQFSNGKSAKRLFFNNLRQITTRGLRFPFRRDGEPARRFLA